MSKFDMLVEKIMGGISQGKTLEDIAKKDKLPLKDIKDQFKKGKKVEKEHSADVDDQEHIAKDHIFEDPEYYTKLAKMEKAES